MCGIDVHTLVEEAVAPHTIATEARDVVGNSDGKLGLKDPLAVVEALAFDLVIDEKERDDPVSGAPSYFGAYDDIRLLAIQGTFRRRVTSEGDDA